MKKYFLTIFLAISTLGFAQTESASDYRGLSVFVGTNAVNEIGGDDVFSLFNSFEQMGFGGVPISAGVSYRYSDLISLSSTFSFNEFTAGESVVNRRVIKEDVSYFNFEINARIHLDFIFNDFFSFDEKVDFFAETGVGYFEMYDQNLMANLNLGLNYWMTDDLALTLKGAGRFVLDQSTPDSRKHIQYMLGLTYNTFKDKDRDGVADKKDVCPDVPGLKEFDGCPDTDADGIPDNKDNCPLAAGTEANGGCPDTDGDGLIDKDDSCPNAAGSSSMNGCPDGDGDMVADNVDKCPDVAGDAANSGCPWPDADGDGVADKDDACPNEAGVAANNGCPAEPTGLIEFINSSKSTIIFKMESSELSGDADVSLTELNALMAQYPKANIVIDGHASSDGPAAYNKKLSEERAEAVKAFLIEAGVDASRLQTMGYGEDMPAEDNATNAGRKANRRAKINRAE